MELKQETQTYEMPHLLTYYECDETGHPSMSMLLSMISMASEAGMKDSLPNNNPFLVKRLFWEHELSPIIVFLLFVNFG